MNSKMCVPGAFRLGAAIWAFTAFPVAAATTETVDAFVRRVYARYRMNGPEISRERPGGAAFYTAPLLDAFVRDQGDGREIGALDWDPICECQDHGNVEVTSVMIAKDEADTVTARVGILDLGINETVTLTLSHTPAGWRIADISEKSAKSIMALLQGTAAHEPRR